jgi:hypothetical protein
MRRPGFIEAVGSPSGRLINPVRTRVASEICGQVACVRTCNRTIRPTEPHPPGRKKKPFGCFKLKKAKTEEKFEGTTYFLKVLRNVRVPDGYVSNISRCVKLKKHTISGLKSHDSHVLMH